MLVVLDAGGSVHRRTETTTSLDQLLLLLAVPGDPPVRYLYLCWCVSGAPDCCFPMRGGIIFSRISLGVRRSFGVDESGETYPGCDFGDLVGSCTKHHASVTKKNQIKYIYGCNARVCVRARASTWVGYIWYRVVV